jgi:hypothetical protein
VRFDIFRETGHMMPGRPKPHSPEAPIMSIM